MLCTMDKRSKNFTNSEIDLLLDIARKYKHVLECKTTNKVTQRKKELAWINIEEEFNQESGLIYRDVKVLRGKYENIKKTSKRKWAEEKNIIFGTKGRPTQSSPHITYNLTDLKVKDILGETNIDGLPSNFDSDTNIVYESPEAGYNVDSMPISVEEEIEPEIVLLPEDSRSPTDETVPKSSVPATPTNTKSSTFIRNRAFGSEFRLNKLRMKLSSPISMKNNRTSAFDKTKASLKIQEMSSVRIELLELQRKLYIDQQKFQEEEHLLKMECYREEHNMKMKLLSLQIQKEEMDIKLKQNNSEESTRIN